MKHKIIVTRDDIARARLSSCPNCPVELAMNRALGLDATGITAAVAHTSFCLWSPARMRSGGMIPLPEVARDFIAAFDRGDAPRARPFEFEVSIDEGDYPR